jgi:hypothetical protein
MLSSIQGTAAGQPPIQLNNGASIAGQACPFMGSSGPAYQHTQTIESPLEARQKAEDDIYQMLHVCMQVACFRFCSSNSVVPKTYEANTIQSLLMDVYTCRARNVGSAGVSQQILDRLKVGLLIKLVICLPLTIDSQHIQHFSIQDAQGILQAVGGLCKPARTPSIPVTSLVESIQTTARSYATLQPSKEPNPEQVYSPSSVHVSVGAKVLVKLL